MTNEKLIDVAIFDGYGANAYPEAVKELIKGESFIEIRSKILPKFIKSLETVSEDVINDVIGNNRLKTGECVRFNNTIYIQNLYTTKCTIVTVDTSRPWTIVEYDGAEGIEYLEFKTVDEKTNYCNKL